MGYYFIIQILVIQAHTFSANAMSSMQIIGIIVDNFAQNCFCCSDQSLQLYLNMQRVLVCLSTTFKRRD